MSDLVSSRLRSVLGEVLRLVWRISISDCMKKYVFCEGKDELLVESQIENGETRYLGNVDNLLCRYSNILDGYLQ
jgi:hypothetical protein